MDSADLNSTISGASERHMPSNRFNRFSESSSCQEEKKETGSSCDEGKANRCTPQHEKVACTYKEENLAEDVQRQSRRNSAATVSSGSSSSSGSVRPNIPQHQSYAARTPENSNLPRNELLGLSLFTYNRNRGAIHKPYHFDGVPANSSDEALERYASRIRQELRHKEMMELAEAAERAAEAGEESFAVRPSTFGSSEWNGMDDPLTPKTSSVTGPSKLTPLLIRRRIEKIGVTELRDVHEVFPDFGEFHTHLRTHLVRTGVDRKMTIFKEKTKNKNSSRFPLSSSSGKNNGMSFLRDLNDWISPSNETAANQEHSEQTCTSAWDFGNIISEHMNLSSSKSPISQPHLETNEASKQPKDFNTTDHTVETQVSTPLSEKRGVTRLRRKTVRRALFDDDDVSPLQSESQFAQNARPSYTNHQLGVYSTSQDVVKNRADFITPVRLRHMRQSDADDVSLSSLIESPVYTVNGSEERLENASISSILLPRELATCSPGNTKLKKKEQHMYDQRDYSCKNIEESRDEVFLKEDMPINGFPIIGPLLLDGVTPVISSPKNSRADEIGTDSSAHAIQNTQLIRLDYEPTSRHPSSIQTPVRDACGCLSIPTNSSSDSDESASTKEDRGLPKLSTVNEDRRSFSGQGNPLAGLISRMSPSRKVFHSMKENRLYFRSKENDAFLNNFLYCSKPIERDNHELPTYRFCAEPCHDTQDSCIELNVDSCCAAILPDTFHDIHRKGATTQSFVSLSGAAYAKSEAEVWFDRATEGFDHFLDQLSGGAHSTSGFTAWNVSFKAPSLNMKKVLAPHADQPTAIPSASGDVAESQTELDLNSYVASPTIYLTRSSPASSPGRPDARLLREPDLSVS